MLQPAGWIGRIEGDANFSRLQYPEHGDDRLLVRIDQHDGGLLSRPALGQNGARQSIRGLVQFAIGERGLLRFDRWAPRIQRGDTLEAFRNRPLNLILLEFNKGSTRMMAFRNDRVLGLPLSDASIKTIRVGDRTRRVFVARTYRERRL